MTKPYVDLSIKNEVGYIEFYHPSHNALPKDLLDQLVTIINSASNNPQIKILVLQSGGDRTFCAGASFNELITIDNAEAGTLFFTGFADVINAMRTCSKLIIGRVQGKAIGGGFGLAAASDYCMATTFAAVKLSELSIGIGPFVIAPAVERKIGLSAFSQVALDAQTFFSAQWAKEKGLYTAVFESLEELDQGVKNFAEGLCTYNPEALKELKSVLWEHTEHWDTLLVDRAKISGKLVLDKFTKEKLKQYKK